MEYNQNNLLLEIDNREPTLLKNEFNNLIKHTFKNLELGDFIFKNKNEILIIIERKTIDDLIASVKDNRYIDQINRYNELDISNSNIYYIIEGNKNNLCKDSKEYKCLYSCIFTLVYKFKFQVIFTIDILETYIIINNLYNNLNIYTPDKNNYKTLSLVKKSKIKKEEWEKYILNLIPNIGLNTSEKILNNFNNNFLTLIDNYKIDKTILDNLIINNRRLSKKVIENIKEFFNFLIAK